MYGKQTDTVMASKIRSMILRENGSVEKPGRKINEIMNDYEWVGYFLSTPNICRHFLAKEGGNLLAIIMSSLRD
jgi:hypothetical protein